MERPLVMRYTFPACQTVSLVKVPPALITVGFATVWKVKT